MTAAERKLDRKDFLSTLEILDEDVKPISDFRKDSTAGVIF